MSTARPELTTPAEPVRNRPRHVTDFARHHTWIIGLALWAAASTAFGIHASGAGLPDPTRFAMLESWLLGLGCLGCPILALRSLGTRLNPQACKLIATFCFALALLLTALTLGGALHFNTLNALFAVALPLSAAIQAVAAVDAEAHAQKRERDALQAARENAVARQIDVRYAALASLDRLRQMTPAERAVLIDVIHGIDDEERGKQGLRLVAGDGGLPRQINSAARTGRS